MMSIVCGILVVGGVCLAAVGGLELVQRLVPTASRQRHNDVAGFIYVRRTSLVMYSANFAFRGFSEVLRPLHFVPVVVTLGRRSSARVVL